MDETEFDPQVFLTAMGNVAASVTVVTTYGADADPQGLTVSAFSSVSLEPPLVLVCIGKEATSIEALRTHGGFTVNFLARGSDRTAMRMASRDESKFDGVPTLAPAHAEAGPVLADAAFAFFECRMREEIDAGDHWVFIGRVLAGEVLDDRHPLVYHRRTFVDLKH